LITIKAMRAGDRQLMPTSFAQDSQEHLLG